MVIQLGDNPTYDWPRGPGDDKRRTNPKNSQRGNYKK